MRAVGRRLLIGQADATRCCRHIAEYHDCLWYLAKRESITASNFLSLFRSFALSLSLSLFFFPLICTSVKQLLNNPEFCRSQLISHDSRRPICGTMHQDLRSGIPETVVCRSPSNTEVAINNPMSALVALAVDSRGYGESSRSRCSGLL